MTKEQQELYEKLLKKVNEFCLGYAAEDVIECIDALVENYESRITEADGYATRYSEALEIIKKTWGSRILNDLQSGFVLGSPYAILPPKEEHELLKEILK